MRTDLASATRLSVLQFAISIASLALLWMLADGEAALRQLADANAAWIVGALLALTLQTVLSALRWKLTAGRLGIVLESGAALREYYFSQIVNQLLPGGVLGDAGRAYRARSEAGLLASGQAVLFERLAGQFALLALFLVSAAATQLAPGGFEGPRWLLPVALLLPACAGVVFLLTPLRLESRALTALRGSVVAFLHAVAAPEIRARQGVLSFATALCNIAAFACCAAAVDLPLSVPAALVLVPLVLFSMLIPLTVSGWGFREGAAAALLPLAGGTGAGALATSITFGAVMLLATLPGFVALALASTPDPVRY